MISPLPITYLMFSHNEEARIADILCHAVQWADEVLVLDKQSTDLTLSICAEYGPKVRVVEIPFTPLGDADLVSACRLATYDWIWVGTCSEIPTRKLIAEAKRILAEKPELDLVHVPRKIYSFGCDAPDSPWGVRSYPFLINRKRAVITNTIHNNFRPQEKTNIAKIPFSEDCCVHHYTHATAKSYIASMTQYFEAESERPDQAELIQEAISRLENRRNLRTLAGSDSFGLECGWRFYWLGAALHAWDKLRGVDVPQQYKTMRTAVLEREWPPAADMPSNPSSTTPPIVVVPNVILCSRNDTDDLKAAREDDLLHALRGRPLSKLVKTLYQIGAHRFQEKKLLFEIFPNLERVVLFEPLPKHFAHLQQQQNGDPRIIVLPYAISDQNGETTFHVSSNDGASSSLLPFGEHMKLFPQVQTAESIPVQTRTLAAAMEQHQLPPPDFLFLDVQGMEHQILATLSSDLLHRLRMIYTEASMEEIYLGARTLNEVEQLLAAEFNFAGYCPLKEQIPCHGNALFVNKCQAWLLLPPEPPVTTTSAWESDARQKPWARALRSILPRKLRRSIRKRLLSLNQVLAN